MKKILFLFTICLAACEGVETDTEGAGGGGVANPVGGLGVPSLGGIGHFGDESDGNSSSRGATVSSAQSSGTGQ